MILKAKTKNSSVSSGSLKKSTTSRSVKAPSLKNKAEIPSSFSYTDFTASPKASVKTKKSELAIPVKKTKKTAIKKVINIKKNVKPKISKTKGVISSADPKKTKLAIVEKSTIKAVAKKVGAVKPKARISIEKQSVKTGTKAPIKKPISKATTAKASTSKSTVVKKTGIKTEIKKPTVVKRAVAKKPTVVKRAVAKKPTVAKKTIADNIGVKNNNTSTTIKKSAKKVSGKKSIKKIKK